MPYVFLKKATKTLTLLAVLTGGSLGLQAMKEGQGDLSPNRIIGSVSKKPALKKGLGFQAFLAQSGKALGRNLVQFVVRAQRPDRHLAKIRQKSKTTAADLPLWLTLKSSPFPDFYAIQSAATPACLAEGAIMAGEPPAGMPAIGWPSGLVKGEIPLSGQHIRPEVCSVGSAQVDMRRLRRILDLFRPALFTEYGSGRPGRLLVGLSLPLAGPQRIRFAIDLASASAPLTDGRLGAHIALRSNRPRDDRS